MGEVFALTEHLAAKAAHQCPEWECYWLRGLVPASWMPSKPCHPSRKWWGWGLSHHGFVPQHSHDPWLLMAGDASGGPHAAEPDLRHVGMGLSQYDLTGERPLAALCWALASGEPQEVDFGELGALETALRLTTANVVYLAGDDKVVNGGSTAACGSRPGALCSVP